MKNGLPAIGDLLLIAALIAGLVVLLYAVRRYVAKEGRKIAAIMDACDYVVIEAAPEQVSDLRNDFENHGWRFHEAKPTSGRGVLNTFVRTSNHAPSLSKLFGTGHDKPLLSGNRSGSDFQMKIKAQGPASDLHA